MKIVGAAAVLVILIVGYSMLFLKGQANLVKTDPDTLCPINHPLSEIVVVLLDMSDEFSEPQKLRIQNDIEQIKNGLGQYGLIEVYAVDRLEKRVTEPVVHLCNPGTGAEMSRIYENPDLARMKWEGFVKKLYLELDRLMSRPPSQTSAIFEAVQATALRTFNRPEYDGLPKRLLIVSDFLQNVPGKMSHYEGIPTFEEFKKSAYFSDIRADLTGVDVTLLYLVRPKTPQKWPEHRNFWERYFLYQNASVELIDPVYGAE